jgi:hypothetical protein
VVAVCGDEIRRHKEVVLRPVHPDRRILHQIAGDGKRVLEFRRDAELLDEVERFKAMAPVADEVPGLTGRRGTPDLAADGAREVAGLLAIQKIPTADEASCLMLHAIGLRRRIP